MDIVKRLRVHQFASEIVLKPRQRELVGFFDDYQLKDKNEMEDDDRLDENYQKKHASKRGLRTEEQENMD